MEPGYSRAQRGELCRLSYGLSAGGGDEGERSLGAQPAAEHQPRLPGVPQGPRGGAQGESGYDPAEDVQPDAARGGGADGADGRDQRRANGGGGGCAVERGTAQAE